MYPNIFIINISDENLKIYNQYLDLNQINVDIPVIENIKLSKVKIKYSAINKTLF